MLPILKRVGAFIGRAAHCAAGRIRHIFSRIKEGQYRFWRTRVPKLAAIVLFSGCLVGAIELIFAQVNLVYVTDGAKSDVLLVQQHTAGDIVEMSGLALSEYDEYYYTAYSGNRAVLTVQRAYPVTVTADGQSHTAWLNGGTVADALEQLGITLGENDYVQPSLHTTLAKGESARVYRVTYTDQVVETVIPYETEYRYTSLLHRWKHRTYVLSEGADGAMETVYRERRVDGEVESSEQIDQYITRQPVAEKVLAYGAGVPVSTIKTPVGYTVTNNVPSSYKYLITNAVCTAYSSNGGRGASRLGLYAGTVAVNPNEIPYGSLLYITSADGSFVYGWAIATDTGTALMEGIIDIDLYYETRLESILNEKKLLNVYVVE